MPATPSILAQRQPQPAAPRRSVLGTPNKKSRQKRSTTSHRFRRQPSGPGPTSGFSNEPFFDVTATLAAPNARWVGASLGQYVCAYVYNTLRWLDPVGGPSHGCCDDFFELDFLSPWSPQLTFRPVAFLRGPFAGTETHFLVPKTLT